MIATAVATDVRRRLGQPAAVAGVLLAGCVVLRVVDPAGGPTICPFKAWTGLDCPGCGATRAAHQLLNGHLGAALGLNAVFVLALPLVIGWLALWFVRAAGASTLRPPVPSPAVLRVAIAVLIVFGVVRNLPIAPFSSLGTGT